MGAAKEAEEKGEKDEEAEKKDDKEKEEKVDPYIEFWEQFGKSIKLGLVEDSSTRTKLSKLLRFKTSKSEGKWISLEQYVDNMQKDQEYIYYISGESLDAVQNLTEFDGKRLMSVTKEGLKFGGDEDELDAKREKYYKEKFDKLTTFLKDTYGKTVEKIAISNRLQNTPCVLVTSQYGYSANMERIMKSQAFSDAKKSSYLFSQKTMEINPRHPIIRELNKRVSGDGEVSEEVKDLALVLLDTALLSSGFHMEDAKDFSARMYRVMKSGLGLESLKLHEHDEIPPESDDDDEDDEEDEEELFDDEDDEEEPKEEEKKEEEKEEKEEAAEEKEPEAKDESVKDEL